MTRRPGDDQIGRRAYSTFAERYDAAAPTKPHNALYERPASLALLGDVAGLDVVDAGCGSGICSEKLARGGAHVCGFDITPEMLDLARKRCAGLDVAFHEGDLAKPLDWLASGSTDAILCSRNSIASHGREAGWSSRWATRCETGPICAHAATPTISRQTAGACSGAVLASPDHMSNPTGGHCRTH